MAMLLSRPGEPTFEIVNDADGLLVNFWRAVQAEPEAVARWAAAPKTEIDLMARHNFVFDRSLELIAAMRGDPTFYDTQCAGYWVYFKGAVVGGRGAFEERFGSRIPDVAVERGIFSIERRADLPGVMRSIADRLRNVTIACGDWRRVVGNASIGYRTPVAVFLDPPYAGSGEEWDQDVYMNSGDVFGEVLSWCHEHGDNPGMRIALCGYEGIEPPPGWSTHEWQAQGGMGNVSGKGEGRESRQAVANKHRERIWFSPHCLLDVQAGLF
jgi:hypothetical protein